MHWTNVWLSLSKFSCGIRIGPKWVSQSPTCMELPDNHLGVVLTSELSEPAEQCGSQTCLGSPQASVGLFTPLISTTPLPKVKILTTFEKVLLHLPSILVPCQELSDPSTSRERSRACSWGSHPRLSASTQCLASSRKQSVRWKSNEHQATSQREMNEFWLLFWRRRHVGRAPRRSREPSTAVWLCHLP